MFGWIDIIKLKFQSELGDWLNTGVITYFFEKKMWQKQTCMREKY